MLGAYIVDKSPDEHFYSIVYDGTVKPQNADDPWELGSLSVDWSSSDGEKLTIENANEDYCYFDKDISGHSPASVISMKAVFKQDEDCIQNGITIRSSILGGQMTAYFSTSDTIRFSGDTDEYYSHDLTEETTIHIVMNGSNYTAWVNGIIAVNNASVQSYFLSENIIRFGKILAATPMPDASYWYDVNVKVTDIYQDGFNKMASANCVLSSPQEDGDYPIENLTNQMPGKPARFTSKQEIDIDIDFTYNQECKYTGLIGHNLSETAIIILKNYSSSSMDDPQLTKVIDWNRDEIHFMLDEDTDQTSNRYWRLSIQDRFNDAYPYIGEMVMGNYKEFSQNFEWQIEQGYEFKNKEYETEFGNIWSYYYGRTREVANIDFERIDDDTVDEIYEMFMRSYGSRYPIVLIWDGEYHLNESIYGKLTDKYKHVLNMTNVNQIKGISVVGLPFAIQLSD